MITPRLAIFAAPLYALASVTACTETTVSTAAPGLDGGTTETTTPAKEASPAAEDAGKRDAALPPKQGHWTSLPMQASVGKISSIWGSSTSDVWFVSNRVSGGSVILHSDGTDISGQNTTGTLRTIWGTGKSNVWALGDGGGHVTFDGTTWKAGTDFTNGDVYATWGSSVAWAVGQYVGGGNLRRTATSLTDWVYGSTYDLPSPASSKRLRAVTGVGSKVFVGGEAGLWMWGGSWEKLADHEIVSLFAIGSGGVVATTGLSVEFATSAGDVLVPDAQPTNVSATKSLLTAVWASAADNVWAVGTKGYVAHFDGYTWTQVTSPTDRDLFAVWGKTSDDIWAVGDEAILHYTKD